MAPSKSHVDDLVKLFEALLLDESYANGVDLYRDAQTLRRRVADEGLSFLTKSLPSLGKALDRGLEDGRLTPPPRWKLRRSGTVPEFLGGLFSLVFEDNGTLRSQPSAVALRALRQICFFGYKIKLPYTPEQERSAIAGFIATDAELELGEDDGLFESASHLIENVLSDLDVDNIRPKHGPGAVATGEKAEEKWTFSHTYRKLDRLYPFDKFFMVGGNDEIEDRKDWHSGIALLERAIARLVLVPKDSRGPRLISCEPCPVQYIQQGIKEVLYYTIEHHPLTRGHVNFRDQTINRELARRSSRDGFYATLDLKDASDRVSMMLLEWLFKRVPHVYSALIATRSSATELPDGSLVTLRKFAPMGSALCFPIEALIFWALVVASVHRTGVPLQEVVKHVFVYGDDIIVPVAWYDLARSALEVAGLKVNDSKSFRRGKFRESCGLDAYDGFEVTPLRLRTLPPSRRTDGEALSAWDALAAGLRSRGYTHAPEFLYARMEFVLGKLPSSYPDCGYFGRWEPSRTCALAASKRRGIRMRWNSNRCCIEVKAYAVKSVLRDTTLDGWPRLLKGVLTPPGDGDPSKVADRRATSVNRRWRTLYV